MVVVLYANILRLFVIQTKKKISKLFLLLTGVVGVSTTQRLPKPPLLPAGAVSGSCAAPATPVPPRRRRPRAGDDGEDKSGAASICGVAGGERTGGVGSGGVRNVFGF